MDTAKKAQIQAYAQATATLLYEETDPEQVKTLAGIEEAVREHMLEHVSPEVGNFLLQQVVTRQADANVPSAASLDA
jgi:hypothetical protein